MQETMLRKAAAREARARKVAAALRQRRGTNDRRRPQTNPALRREDLRREDRDSRARQTSPVISLERLDFIVPDRRAWCRCANTRT